MFTGVVVNAKMQSTATVEWEHRKYIRKYERYLTQKTRVKAHNPAAINARQGDIVKIKECRPLSKTKNFIIIEKVGHERLFEAKQELLEAGKKKVKDKQDKNEAVMKEDSQEDQDESS